MSDEQQKRSQYLLFNVKPIWVVSAPSTMLTLKGQETGGLTFTIYGVDRGSMDISRNWTVLHSVEEFGQGFIATPPDLRVTIAVKEAGESFEHMRRLGKTGTMFDISCNIMRETQPDANQNSPHGEGVLGYEPWLDGFERYEGCIINREGQTIDIGAFPVREFEIMFLRHVIEDAEQSDMYEGDGSYSTYDKLKPPI